MCLKFFIIFLFTCLFAEAIKEPKDKSGTHEKIFDENLEEFFRAYNADNCDLSENQQNPNVPCSSGAVMNTVIVGGPQPQQQGGTQNQITPQNNNGVNSHANGVTQMFTPLHTQVPHMHSYGSTQQQQNSQVPHPTYRMSSTIPVVTQVGYHPTPHVVPPPNPLHQSAPQNQQQTPIIASVQHNNYAPARATCFQTIYRMLPTPPVNPINGIVNAEAHPFFRDMDVRQMNAFSQFRTLGHLVRSGACPKHYTVCVKCQLK